MKKPRAGFTIVELLIVIVVIAILAAISIAVYSGARGRANDTVVQSDLHNYAAEIEVFFIDNGAYPSNAAELNGLHFSKSASAYSDDTQALKYCRNGTSFVIAAESKSGNGFYYGNKTGGLARRLNSIQADWCRDNYSIPTTSGRIAMWATRLQDWDDSRRYVTP